MRWFLLAACLVLGAVVALRGPRRFGTAPRADADAASEAEREAARLHGRPAAEAEGVLPAPLRPAGEPNPEAIKLQLRRAAPAGRLEALAEVEGQGAAAAEYIADVIPLLAHEDPRVAQAAADLLASLGAVVVEPLLAEVLRLYERLGNAGAHGSWAMSWGPYVLAKVGEPAAVPVARVLGHEQAYHWALVTFQRLATLRTPLSAATDVVLRRLREVESESALTFTIDAVPSLGSDAARAVPQLVELTRDARRQVQFSAIQALGRIGPDAASALSDLEHLRRGRPTGEDALSGALDAAIARIRGDR